MVPRLFDFHDKQGAQGQARHHQPLNHVQRNRLKDRRQSGNGNDGDLEGQADQEGIQHFQVAENTDLKERFLTADVKGVDQLGAAQHGEGHGPARRWGSGAVEEHPADGESQQRDHADEAALDGDAVGHTPGEQAFFGVGRRLFHNILIHRLHAQGESGQTVGDQVHPKQLDCQQRGGQPHEESGQHGDDFSDIAGQKKMDGFFDVFKDSPSLPHRGHNGGKVVVGQNHIGGAFGYIGAGNPHSAADVSGLEGGRVVDAVSGHGHHGSPGLERLDDPHLVLRGNPGEYGVFKNMPAQLLLAHGVQLGAGERAVLAPKDSQFLGDGPGGDNVIPGDHHREDSRLLAFPYRSLGLWPGGIDHSQQAAEHQAGFDFISIFRQALHIPVGHPKHPQGPAGHVLVVSLNLGPLGRGQRGSAQPHGIGLAPAQQHVGGALGDDPVPAAAQRVDGGHQFSPGIKGDLPHSGKGEL